MRKNIIRTIAALSLLASLSLITANAQTHLRTTFKVPFNFTVGEKAFPAGEYFVEALPNGGAAWIRITSDQERKGITFTSLTQTFGKVTSKDKLVFRRYGDQYFLGRYSAATENKEYDLTPARAEKALLKKARTGKDYMAATPSTVEIGAISQGN